MSAVPPEPRPPAARRKGQPILVLLAILGGWVGVRAATWDGGDADFSVWRHGETVGQTSFGLADRHTDPSHPVGGIGQGATPLILASSGAALPGRSGRQAMLGMRGATSGKHMALSATLAMAGAARPDDPALVMAAVVTVPSHPELVPSPPNPSTVALTPPRAAPMLQAPSAPPSDHRAGLPHWSADGWLLLRQGGGRSGAPGGTLLLPSYGANQLGAVLRYRLAPASGFGPTIYGRAYGALNGTGEREVALGFSARPLPALPLAALVEGRVSRFSSGITRLRPAVTLVTEMPPVMLPLALRAETYVQAGYVGGLAATSFVDGQFRLEHVASHHARGELRLGGGIWGGAQRGAGRLDVGPGATVAFATGRTGAHLSLDWRFRVAGSAMPGSGPTMTLAAGF